MVRKVIRETHAKWDYEIRKFSVFSYGCTLRWFLRWLWLPPDRHCFRPLNQVEKLSEKNKNKRLVNSHTRISLELGCLKHGVHYPFANFVFYCSVLCFIWLCRIGNSEVAGGLRSLVKQLRFSGKWHWKSNHWRWTLRRDLRVHFGQMYTFHIYSFSGSKNCFW